MKTLTQSKLYALCREHGWKPLFFSRKSSSISAESLEREIQVCLAAGQQTLSRHLLDAAHHEFGETFAHDEAQLSSGGSAVGGDRSPSVANRLLGFFGLLSRQKLSRILSQTLLLEGLQPAVFCVDHHADLARQWGLEMEHWLDQNQPKLVLQLGDMAAKLGLNHQSISQSMGSARVALMRIKKLIVLKAIQQSPHRSRSDYETALVAEWCMDPECQDYLSMLRKVISFRLRQKKNQSSLMVDFFDELIEQELNQKLFRGLLSSS